MVSSEIQIVQYYYYKFGCSPVPPPKSNETCEAVDIMRGTCRHACHIPTSAPTVSQIAHHQHALRRRGGSGDHGVPSELRQIHLDGLPGGEVKQRAARGRGRRLISLLLLLRQQDPPARVEAVVDDACAQLTGLPDAAAVHPQLAHQAEPHEVGACGAAVALHLPECGGCAGLLGTPDSRKDWQGASVVG
uniref:Uncharacterized protein n=1 Tax=Zea mays TaxID=4577 RepID=A0A804LUN9_MAIZE